MKKSSNVLSKMLLMAAFGGFAGTVSAQTEVIAAAGSSSDEFTCVVGEALVADNTGFLAALLSSPELNTAVKGVVAASGVQIKSYGNGRVVALVPEALLAENAYYSVYDANGILLSKADIASAETRVSLPNLATGKVYFVVVGTEKKGKLASAKLMK